MLFASGDECLTHRLCGTNLDSQKFKSLLERSRHIKTAISISNRTGVCYHHLSKLPCVFLNSTVCSAPTNHHLFPKAEDMLFKICFSNRKALLSGGVFEENMEERSGL